MARKPSAEARATEAKARAGRRLRIGVTVGDPSGIGPEVALKALLGRGAGSGEPIVQRHDVLLIGPPWLFREMADRFGLRAHFEDKTGACEWAMAQSQTPPPSSSGRTRRPVPFFPVHCPDGCEAEFVIPYGKVDALCGQVALRAIEEAARLAMEGAIDAVVTAPISKAALNAAGGRFPGHTEMLQSLSHSPRVGMLLVGGGLRVALVTIHEALSNVPRLLTAERVLGMLDLTNEFFRVWLGEPPRIALAAFNPHAGEDGMFGDEEERILRPAVARAVARGLRVDGPLPGDTVFHLALEGQYDVVVATYHDQALIPIKTLDFHGGVNVTMGLPFIRTSPDHGTAHGIAGQGIARPSSMRSALLLACELAAAKAGRLERDLPAHH